MKVYQMYVCSKCKKESSNKEEIELCEGMHMGLKTLEEKREYDALLSAVKYCSYLVSCTNNDETRKSQDYMIDKLIKFETEHNMVKMIQKNIYNSVVKESSFIDVNRGLNVRNPGDKEWDSYDYIVPPQK